MKEFGSEGGQNGEEAKCPVDHKTRELWLQQAQQARASTRPTQPSQASSTTPESAATTTASSSSWSSWLRVPFFSRQPQSQQATDASQTPSPRSTVAAPPRAHPQLDETRVVSSIPRTADSGPSACPVNHEQETGASASGHWVYPSERQFFEAMRRKGYDAAAADMKTVVPIHNAVNERAWAEILKWEAPYVAPAAGAGACAGPRLHSFAGRGTAAMSPKARINTLLGYTAPFDRHDWVVDRCGTRVEYVIDFYAGRKDGAGAGKLNFYLDVRPKLNTWEGVKMRALRAAGLV
ncbi:84d0c6ce-b007-4f87-845f-474e7ab8d718 [Thermothielavioides terrestris]|jgi:cytochrome c heme-lyase|uniref:Holocytochrome c-type synthase n=1 Tax=Thermothielavioides terrestris TaxID=2587410 RepID=A0A446BP01_9PEZI|nr:84d0c6ce-b007-4f87-845f-474e7ab8d718 [Thermothielavioides terrestris]